MRIIALLALCAPLSACGPGEVQSATTVANLSVDLLLAQSEAVGQFLVDTGKITPEQFTEWQGKAKLAVAAFRLGTITYEQFSAIVGEIGK